MIDITKKKQNLSIQKISMGFKREYCQNYDESSSEDNFEDFFEENCSNCSGSIISTVSGKINASKKLKKGN